MTLLAGRCISFSTATLVTWLLNRRLVFVTRDGSSGSMCREYTRYLAVQVAGAATNLTVFFALLRALPQLAAVPAVPLAAGALLALAVTYLGTRHFVFPDYDSALEPANER
jgi:putative flippase GtrA